jgi:hypothetical protein
MERKPSEPEKLLTTQEVDKGLFVVVSRETEEYDFFAESSLVAAFERAKSEE